MERLWFYITHSWNDLRVGGKRTLFALLCIAAGVAAVVSLQTLGAMIEHSLTTNLQELNRGDIRVFPPGPGPGRKARADVRVDSRYLATTGAANTVFTESGFLAIEQATLQYDPDAEVSYRFFSPNDPIAGTFLETEQGSRTIFPIIIEADYSIYRDTLTVDGQKVGDVIESPTDIVISDNAAEDYGLSVGDRVQLNGADEMFTVRGIVDREVEAFTENFFFVTLFGFYYADSSVREVFNFESGSDIFAAEIFINLSDPSPGQVSSISQNLERRFPFISVSTTSDIRERNSQLTGAVNDLVLLMGVVSLLIGGVGIVNTMFVIVTRRTTEIAVLKTIGLKARQVTLLFLVESIILGVVGSLIGCVLGLALAALLENFEVWFGTRLDWVFSYEAVLRGFILGVVVTAIFGFLPTLVAGQVRPGNVLRPSTTRLPNLGILQTLVALSVIFTALGVIVWSILGGTLSPDVDSDTLLVALDGSVLRFGGALGIALLLGLAAGIGGAALAPGLDLVRRPPEQLGRAGRSVRYGLLLWGLVVQTVLQGVLFFSIGIVATALLQDKITTEGASLSLAVAVVLGLAISFRTFRHQRNIFVILGAVLLGFLLMLSGGMILGTALGAALGALLPGELWQLAVDLMMGIALVELAFVAVITVVGVLWFLVTLTARVPAFDIPDIKISFRALVTNRNRVSMTLLALVIGVLTLSLVTMFADSLKQYFALNLEDNLGGNVVVLTFSGSGSEWETTLDNLDNVLDETDGVENYSLVTTYQVEFVALERQDGSRLKRTQLIENMQAELPTDEDISSFLDVSFGSIDGRQTDGSLPVKEFLEGGRQLQPEDAGQQRIVIRGARPIRATGIKTGDFLIFNFPDPTTGQRRQLRFEVVGITDEVRGELGSDIGSFIYAPIDSFEGIRPEAIWSVANVEEDQLSEFRGNVRQNVATAVVLETRFLNQIVNRLIDQFTALPFVVAVLNLVTGGAVIANSVALSTLERRREIGVMKSLGVQRERVLGMLLLENSLMGLLAGIIGVGFSLLLLIQLWAFLFNGDLRGSIPVDTALILMALCVAISLLAAVLTAWGASGEKPLNVLRNE